MTPGGDRTNATNAEPRRILSELEHLLQAPGCPACRHLEEAERRFFSWFEIESFSIVEMQVRLRAAMGLCSAHLRRLIEQLGEGRIMTTVMREAVAGAREHLTRKTVVGPCPACEATGAASRHAVELVLDALGDARQARLYAEHAGVCVEHFRQASTVAEAPTLKQLAQRLSEALAEAGDERLIDVLAGVDRDAPHRASWRLALPEAPLAGSTLERMHGLLAIETCPVCLSVGRGEKRYLQWLLERIQENDPALRSDPGELCSAHLADVAVADEAAAVPAAQAKCAARLAELQRLLDHLSGPSPTARRGRRARSDQLDRALAELNSEHHCPACHARDAIVRSQLSLLLTSLALPAIRDQYVNSHGLCARHALGSGAGPAARLIRAHADARLAVLGWELEETARKYAWASRHEPAGPERNGWLRATVQIDGRAFEGCPAPAAASG